MILLQITLKYFHRKKQRNAHEWKEAKTIIGLALLIFKWTTEENLIFADVEMQMELRDGIGAITWPSSTNG